MKRQSSKNSFDKLNSAIEILGGKNGVDPGKTTLVSKREGQDREGAESAWHPEAEEILCFAFASPESGYFCCSIFLLVWYYYS